MALATETVPAAWTFIWLGSVTIGMAFAIVISVARVSERPSISTPRICRLIFALVVAIVVGSGLAESNSGEGPYGIAFIGLTAGFLHLIQDWNLGWGVYLVFVGLVGIFAVLVFGGVAFACGLSLAFGLARIASVRQRNFLAAALLTVGGLLAAGVLVCGKLPQHGPRFVAVPKLYLCWPILLISLGAGMPLVFRKGYDGKG